MCGMGSVRSLIVLIAVVAAIVATAQPAAAAERQCGVVTGIFLGDLPSGGTVTIDGRKFLVGGAVPRNVDLSAAAQLSVGSRACAEGEFRVLSDGSVDLQNGRVFPNTTGLPNTSTEPVPLWPAPLLSLAAFFGAIALASRYARGLQY